MAGAQQNRSPLVVLGGRAPEMRWGSGSLQEIDHLPFVSPLTKSAETVKETGAHPRGSPPRAIDAALAQPSGPTFVDYPLDVVFSEAEARGAGRAGAIARQAGRSLRRGRRRSWPTAERPAIMAGTGLYWAHGEEELRALAEALGIPVFLNGMGRGCLPADHELCFSRARGKGLKEADVALVVGVPLDFRLGFGGSFGEETKIVSLDVAPKRADGDPPARPRAGRRHPGDAGRATRSGRARRRRPRPHRRLGRSASRDRGREARGRGRRAQRRPRPAASRPHLQGARTRSSTATRS